MGSVDIIDDAEHAIELWTELALRIDKGGTGVDPAWTGQDLGSSPTIDLGEHVKLFIDLGTISENTYK